MQNCLVRIDDRLVHGQILEAWIPRCEAKAIFIIDDNIASDTFREAVIRMAVPKEINVVVFSVEQSISENTRSPFISHTNTIFLFSNTANALAMFEAGFSFQFLNIGNICSPNAKTMLTPAVMLNDKDIKNINNLLCANVIVTVQRTPSDEPIAMKIGDYLYE